MERVTTISDYREWEISLELRLSDGKGRDTWQLAGLLGEITQHPLWWISRENLDRRSFYDWIIPKSVMIENDKKMCELCKSSEDRVHWFELSIGGIFIFLREISLWSPINSFRTDLSNADSPWNLYWAVCSKGISRWVVKCGNRWGSLGCHNQRERENAVILIIPFGAFARRKDWRRYLWHLKISEIVVTK